MSRVIYKYPVMVQDEFTLLMPEDAEILCVQVQQGKPQIWALVEMGADMQQRNFSVLCTGHMTDLSIGENAYYIGTFQTHNGGGIWHLFERV